MQELYSVRSSRVTTPWFGTKKFYLPMVFNEISKQHHCMLNEEDLPSVWGFDTEDEAWAAIDQEIIKQGSESFCLCFSKSDREDFHADG